MRDAVKSARGAQPKWAGATAYLRGQVLYRVAEMMEGRAGQFVDELHVTLGTDDAEREVADAIDRWVWYAGCADKIASLTGTVNSVAGPYFDFTVPEPVGVVGIVAPDEPALLGLVSVVAPALAAGNAVVVLASEANPLVAITLAEVLATSDVPGGVVNVLTGSKSEVGPWLAGHGDVDSVDVTGAAEELAAEMERQAADDVKRVVRHRDLASRPTPLLRRWNSRPSGIQWETVIQTIAFDGDDTLWHNETLFSMTQERFRALLADHVGGDELDARLLATERENVAVYGYGVKGFTLSMIETAIEVTNGSVDGDTIYRILAFAKDQLNHPVELLRGVPETLAALASRYRLLLITKGDLFDQESKIARSGLAEVFDGIEVVAEKEPPTYSASFAGMASSPRPC